jgi:hypothetical protein
MFGGVQFSHCLSLSPPLSTPRGIEPRGVAAGSQPPPRLLLDEPGDALGVGAARVRQAARHPVPLNHPLRRPPLEHLRDHRRARQDRRAEVLHPGAEGVEQHPTRFSMNTTDP